MSKRYRVTYAGPVLRQSPGLSRPTQSSLAFMQECAATGEVLEDCRLARRPQDELEFAGLLIKITLPDGRVILELTDAGKAWRAPS